MNYQVAKINHFHVCMSIHRLRLPFISVSWTGFLPLHHSHRRRRSFRFKTNYFNKCLLREIFLPLLRVHSWSELCCERWNEFQVFNDHVVSNHKYSMTFARKLSIKLEEITLKKVNKNIKLYLLFMHFMWALWVVQQSCKFIYY